jgi:hypothetical protein
MNKALTFTFLFVVAVAGCATPYQKIEDTEGMGGYGHSLVALTFFEGGILCVRN